MKIFKEDKKNPVGIINYITKNNGNLVTFDNKLLAIKSGFCEDVKVEYDGETCQTY